MNGYQVTLSTLADMSDRLADASDDLDAAFSAIDAETPDAGATTAALNSVVDQLVLGVAAVLGELTDVTTNLDAIRVDYQTCEDDTAAVFNRIAELPAWLTTSPFGEPGEDR